MVTRPVIAAVSPVSETPVSETPVSETPVSETPELQPAAPQPAPQPARFIVVSARVPLPLDQWEAASVMHGMASTIKQIESLMCEATGDSEFKLSTDIVNSVTGTAKPAVEGGKKRGRKSNAERTAAQALAAEMAARAAAAPQPAAAESDPAVSVE